MRKGVSALHLMKAKEEPFNRAESILMSECMNEVNQAAAERVHGKELMPIVKQH